MNERADPNSRRLPNLSTESKELEKDIIPVLARVNKELMSALDADEQQMTASLSCRRGYLAWS
ncbi:hypothetical protein OK016_15385 [Vibrio chagasii]|nr:hypothetical protein [Vibrio chagasii]